MPSETEKAIRWARSHMCDCYGCRSWLKVLAEHDRLVKELARLTTPKPASEWHEDRGPVLWFHFPICEPPYAGTPLDCGWPNDSIGEEWLTHWTHLPTPRLPKEDDKS